jgi:uncharacterized membrane protein
MLTFITRYAWLFLVAAVSTSAVPEGASVTGIVTDDRKEPLMGVTVVIKHVPTGTFRGAITRADGRYMLRGLRSGGPYSIMLSMTGYKSQSKDDIQLKDGQKLVLDFRMPQNRK